MSIHLLRHAKAGQRKAWAAPDHLRPLDAEGRAQAARLVEAYASVDIDRIASSHFVRCVQTVEPLAAARGLPIEIEAVLAEGSAFEDVLELYRRSVGTESVLCTHGDVVEMTIERLLQQDVPIEGPLKLKKGSTWVLDQDGDGRVVRARYVPPP